MLFQQLKPNWCLSVVKGPPKRNLAVHANETIGVTFVIDVPVRSTWLCCH